MSSTPLVAWAFASPSGSAMRPSMAIGLFQWPPPLSSVVTSFPRRRLVDVEAAVRVVDVEQAARDHRARAGIAVVPDRVETAAAQRPRLGRAVVGRDQPDALAAPPHRRRREEVRARRRRDDLQLMSLVRLRAADPGERQQPDLPVLAALRDELRREVDGRRRAEIEVVGVQLRRVRRRVVADQLRLRRTGREPRRPSSCGRSTARCPSPRAACRCRARRPRRRVPRSRSRSPGTSTDR